MNDYIAAYLSNPAVITIIISVILSIVFTILKKIVGMVIFIGIIIITVCYLLGNPITVDTAKQSYNTVTELFE